MKRISPERKTGILAKLLPPYNMAVAAVAQMEGISEATLYNWRNQAKSEGNRFLGSRKKGCYPEQRVQWIQGVMQIENPGDKTALK